MSRVRPIRLSGKPVYGLSFDPTDDDGAEYDPDYSLDVAPALRAIGFSSPEIRFVIAHRVDRIPRSRLAKHLDWEPRKVEAVRKRVERRLKMSQDNEYFSVLFNGV